MFFTYVAFYIILLKISFLNVFYLLEVFENVS